MLSFFRKLSIGSKIRDGLIMGTAAEDVVDKAAARTKGELAAKDETELRESIYGTCNPSTHKLSRDWMCMQPARCLSCTTEQRLRGYVYSA